jgi:threonylcarbamoyladenosine tRNA methylthiotransferase MtaB
MDISLHVFKYSERDDTEAAEMLGVVPENVVKRSKMMRGLSVKKRRSFMKASWKHETVLLKAKIKRVTFMVLKTT